MIRFTVADRLPSSHIPRSDEASLTLSSPGLLLPEGFLGCLCATCSHTANSAPQPGVEQVPQGVAKHVYGVDYETQADSWPQSKPWGQLHVLAPFPAEHTTPASNIGREAEPEEAQRSLSQNDTTYPGGEYDDYGSRDIW